MRLTLLSPVVLLAVGLLEQQESYRSVDVTPPYETDVSTTSAPHATSDPAIERAKALCLEPVGDVRIVDARDLMDVPPAVRQQVDRLAAFRLYRNGTIDPTIYISRRSWYYAKALEVHGVIYLLAGSIVHELAHGKGADEATALQAELDFLNHWIVTTISADERRLLKAQSALKKQQLKSLGGADTHTSKATADIER